MPLLAAARARLARWIAPAPSARAFAAAAHGRLTADWFTAATSADAEIRSGYRRLIDRSRALERDNDYMRGFLGDCQDNVVGAIREDLTVAAGEYQRGKDGNYRLGPDGTPVWQPDKVASFLIFEAWQEWSKKGACTVCGRHSWRDVKNLAVRGVPRDGNVLVRKITGPAAGNRFGFALQLWEIDHLDLDKQRPPGRGENEIRFGIEFDAQRRPVAYWLRARHPGDSAAPGSSLRVAAREVYHLYITERAEQSLGIPWIVSAITRLRQLGAFEEAAVIAARLGASKAGFFKTTGQGEYTGDRDAHGRAQMTAEPGQFEELPQGWDIAPWSPEYPNIDTAVFRKAMLMGIACGLRRAYPNFARDLEGVNYSSARVGVIDERETWKGLQLWFTEHFYDPVFADWLEASLLTGAIPLPLGKFAKFNRPRFKARRWPWVDPAKDISAAQMGIALRITSRDEIIEERGGDRDDVFLANKEDENFADAIGLDLTPPDPQPETVGSPADIAAADEAEAAAPPKAPPKKKPAA
jgi:lambda family phage portal protein